MIAFFTSRLGIAAAGAVAVVFASGVTLLWAHAVHGPAQFQLGKTVAEAKAQARFDAAVANLGGLADEADLAFARCDFAGGVFDFANGRCTGVEGGD